MKAIFGILSLVVVLAIVGSIARKQLHAVNGAATAAIPGGMPAAVAADPNGMSVPQQARSMQEQARSNTARALEEGVKRNQRADP